MIFCSCQFTDSWQIVFLGHPYYWHESGNRLDPRVENLLLQDFDQIWLGGDICAKTTADAQTLQYLDQYLKFEEGNSHWAWGNHDVKYGNLDRLKESTKRPGFYLDCNNGLCVLVINTNLFQWPNAKPDEAFCQEMGAQNNLIKSLTDSLGTMRQLVVLHHYGLLSNTQTMGTYDLDTVFNFYKPQLKVVCEDSTQTFITAWYPHFVEIQEAGIPVTFVCGDMGMRAKQFEFQTDEGIWFLGAGINNSIPEDHRPDYITNFDPDQILMFEYFPSTGKLKWEFVPLGIL